mgnify:CR=1 FL=1
MKKNPQQQVVKISRALTQFAIASPTNRRKLGYERTVENHLGIITVQSLKTLTVKDFKVLCGIVAYIQRNLNNVVAGSKEGLSEIQLQDGDKLFCIDVDMYSFVKNYLHTTPSAEEYRLLLESLDVLLHTSITGHYIVEKKDAKERVIQKATIVSHVKATAVTTGKRKKYRIRFIFPEWLYKMWEDPRAFLFDNYYIQKTTTRTSTLLCVFLMTQKNARSYSKKYLAEQLGLESAIKNRTELRELRRAFDDLLKIGYIRSYYEEKREDDIYFVFTRK